MYFAIGNTTNPRLGKMFMAILNTALVIALLLLGSAAQAAKQTKLMSNHDALYQSMLAGGALKTCSSYATHNCHKHDFTNQDKKHTLYSINSTSLARLSAFITQAADNNEFAALSHIVTTLNHTGPKSALTKKQLFDYFSDVNMKDSVNKLNDPAYYALLDHLEAVQLNSSNTRKKERADVLASQSSAAVSVYQGFVDQVRLRAEANKEAPHIVVMTASSRDALEVVDFYTSVFASFGIKTSWLPIDASVAKAIDMKPWAHNICKQLDRVKQRFNVFDRARIYPAYYQQQQMACEQPHRLTELVNSAHGLFINGGDQSLSLASMTHENGEYFAFWQAALLRVAQFKMIVGGTSAGAAVQSGIAYQHANSSSATPIPMISNGRSDAALTRGVFAAFAPSQRCNDTSCAQTLQPNDVTYMPTGGANVFDIGVVDTHFSERNREGRLIALALSTNTRLAVGIDETTALFYKRTNKLVTVKVIGKHGAFLVDGTNNMKKSTVKQGYSNHQFAGYTHYLPTGSHAALNLFSNQWQLNAALHKQSQATTLPALNNGTWRDKTREKCGTPHAIKWQQNTINYALMPNENTQFFTNNNKQDCGYLFLPFVITTQQSVVAPST